MSLNQHSTNCHSLNRRVTVSGNIFSLSLGYSCHKTGLFMCWKINYGIVCCGLSNWFAEKLFWRFFSTEETFNNIFQRLIIWGKKEASLFLVSWVVRVWYTSQVHFQNITTILPLLNVFMIPVMFVILVCLTEGMKNERLFAFISCEFVVCGTQRGKEKQQKLIKPTIKKEAFSRFFFWPSFFLVAANNGINKVVYPLGTCC